MDKKRIMAIVLDLNSEMKNCGTIKVKCCGSTGGLLRIAKNEDNEANLRT